MWLRSAPPALMSNTHNGLREEGGREEGGEEGGEGEGERDECDLGDLVTDELLQLGNLSSYHVCVCVMIGFIYL